MCAGPGATAADETWIASCECEMQKWEQIKLFVWIIDVIIDGGAGSKEKKLKVLVLDVYTHMHTAWLIQLEFIMAKITISQREIHKQLISSKWNWNNK